MKFLHSLVVILLLHVAKGKQNKKVTMPNYLYCGKEYEIDGATVRSEAHPSSLYKNSACIVTFEADEGQFLVNLTDVRISTCPAKLSIYFDDDTYGVPDYVIDCSHRTPGVVKTDSKYVTIRLDRSIDKSDYFNIILTAYHQKIWGCEFKCDNGYCIDDELKCDRIDHCSDNSDEIGSCIYSHTDFDDLDIEHAAKMGAAVIIGIIVAIVVICIACCVGIICCCRRRQGFKGRVLRGPASQATTTTTVPTQPAAQPLVPMQGGYQPVQPGTYPPPQPAAGYQPQPVAMPVPPQPAPYPPQPAAYPAQPQYPNTAPPPYQEKPPPVEGPYPPPPVHQQLQQSGEPSGVTPSAPPPI